MPIDLGDAAATWPGALDGLRGTFVAQAVLKRSRDEGGVLAPGNLVSEPVEVNLDPDTYGIPVVTASVDFVGAVALIVTVVAVGLT